MVLHLLVGRGTVRAEVRRRNGVAAAAEAGWETPGDLAERLAELVALPELGAARVPLVVRLEGPLAQVRVLDGLPPVGGRALRQLVELRAGHYFRKNGIPLVVDVRWARRRAAGRRAIAGAAPAPVIEAVLAGARTSGRTVRSIRPASPAGRGLDLLPEDERGRRIRRGFARAGIAAATGLVLWVAAGSVVGLRVARAEQAASVALDTLGPAVEALAGLREQVARAHAALGAVDSAAAHRGRVLEAVLRAAAAIPDSAYLVTVALDTSGAGRMAGVAPKAVVVLASAERAGVPNPRLEGDAVPIHADGRRRERFTLRFGMGKP
ncbi:MAG TPA: hypothetical protein VLA95_07945 [Gemmatimonadales bacterium]|nr:hypothetical protein [Gemmatimonadales bacterium]HSE28149.1 hypothetical protein [Gemmatimonadales bacterium]